jgi:N-acetylmuramic acid 6-phosphate (MurNAc-6-P) etherase
MGRAAEETAFDELATEARDPQAADLDLQSTAELVALMNEADAGVPGAVARAGDAIASAIDAVATRLRAGGRLVYVGAGTSGRLAVVDAAECESTFAVPPGRVVALIAGGPTAAATAQEEAEDDRAAGAARRMSSPPSRRHATQGRPQSRSSPSRAPSSVPPRPTRSSSSSAPR